jgi:hypothetical protein
MQDEINVLKNLLEFINDIIETKKIDSDINTDIRCFACQFEPEIKVMIRYFAEEIEDILYNDKNLIEDNSDNSDNSDEEEEVVFEIKNVFVKDKIILHLYELKNFIENRLLNFEKGNKRLWSMS